MTGMLADHPDVQQVGEEWIQAVLAKDFQALAGLCHAAVRSRLVTPSRIVSLENAADLSSRVAGWFQECSSLQIEVSRVEMVGEKLGIFYRLLVVENGQPYAVEQQIFSTVQGHRIEQLSLLCSGFQPVPGQMEASTAQPASSALAARQPLQAAAFLKVETGAGQESTCAILTPAIKRKLGDIDSGQVLEIQVNDPSAKEDIEAWCRLSGNALLQMDSGAGQALHFYLRKK